MALPRTSPESLFESIDLPTSLFGTGEDYELYETDDEYVVTVEMPGFETDEITVSWDDGVLNVAAEHVDEERSQERTYHRRLRLPKSIDSEEIAAEYSSGVLEVGLPIVPQETVGREIPVE